MKIIYRLFLVFIFLHISDKSFAMSYEEQIPKLYLENKKLDKKIFENLTFELFDFQPLFSGQNAKCILKGRDGKLWFFKTEEQPIPLNIVSYSWFLLCGENKPACYNIALPINGELEKGIIQEFISDAKTIDNISVSKLSKQQIEFIQRQQIIDWFIYSEETFECDPGQFLIKNNEIINVEKGKAFSTDYLSESLIDNFNNSLHMQDNYYNIFWQAYVNKEINIDFNKSFELIDYIQSLDDSFIKEVFKFSMPKEFSVSLLIKRKHSLRNDFEKYYHYLANQRGDIFKVPAAQGYFGFLKIVFKKLKKELRKKQIILKRLEKKNGPQENIKVVLSTEVRGVIKKFGFPDQYYKDNIINMKNELNGLKDTLDNLNKKIALYLFLAQIKPIERGITEENFFEFSPLLTYSPKTINPETIEANLRVTNYRQKGFYIDTLDEFLKSDNDTITHILYILTTCFTFGEPQEVINRYRLDNKYNKEIMQVLDILNIRSVDRNYIPRVIEHLDKLNYSWAWKNFFLSYFYYLKAFWYNEISSREKAISELKKVICLTKDKRLLYISYLFLGYLYEHNKDCFRFGEGFNLDAAINAYRKATEVNPDSITAHLNLYTLYLIKGKPNKVWYHLNCIKKIDTQYAAENFHFAQDFYEKIEKFKKSDQIEMLKACSLNGEQHYILSLIFSLKQNRDLAKIHLEEAKRKEYFKNEN